MAAQHPRPGDESAGRDQADQAAASCSQDELWQRPSAAQPVSAPESNTARKTLQSEISLTRWKPWHSLCPDALVSLFWHWFIHHSKQCEGHWFTFISKAKQHASSCLLSVCTWSPALVDLLFLLCLVRQCLGCFNFRKLYSAKRVAKCSRVLDTCQLKNYFNTIYCILMCVFEKWVSQIRPMKPQASSW